MNWVMAMVTGIVLCMVSGAVQAAETTLTLGAVEDVILLSGGTNTMVRARIDTGAATSSVDVCRFSVKGGYVTFTLGDRCGGTEVRLPLVEWKEVHTSEGRDRRPVVKLEICLGPRRLKTLVTLNDRSGMDYPFLVGRKTLLHGHFVVDVSREMISPPICPEAKRP